MSRRVTVVIRDKDRQYEGLRYSLGLMFESHDICMVVLDHEVPATEEYTENAAFIDEMGGSRLSNLEANTARHGFGHITDEELIDHLATSDLVVPF